MIAARWQAWQADGGLRRRVLGMGAALALEALLALVLLTLNAVNAPQKREVVVDITARNVEEPPPPPPPEPAKAAARAPRDTPVITPPPAQSVEPVPAPQPVPLPPPPILPVRPVAPAPPRSNEPVYGPPDTGGRASSYDDSPRLGTAPNGEAMYAAAWYTRPTDTELRGYLSTADGPGWALITCKTVADFRVEDCIGLDEYPEGSHMLRAVLAAAWQFRVRPPRRGGQAMVGAWVRIRIDYEIKRGDPYGGGQR
jgi:protein TonB